MKSKYKIGDILQFKFAGAYEIGKITNIEKRERGMVYTLNDGKYKYNIWLAIGLRIQICRRIEQ